MTSGWWAAGGVACLAIAVVYGVKRPRSGNGIPHQRGVRQFALSWGHSLAWLFLALWSSAHLIDVPEDVGLVFAGLAALAYLGFVGALLSRRRVSS